ncbi:MAG: hypothetical protein ACT4P9_10915 [Betaproteobacteria bacterium]
MSSASQTATQEPAPRKAVGEWIWRFLAVVMLFSVGWVLWVAYQLNPPMLVTTAAFEAAAKARANQNAAGVIVPKPGAEAPKAEPEAPKAEAEAGKPEPVAKEPPVNLEKLKLSDSITAPLAQDAKKK